MIYKNITYVILAYTFTSGASMTMPEDQDDRKPSTINTLKTVQIVADVALATSGHRTTQTFLTQGNHRTPSEWWNQGNHRSISEWFSRVPSHNSRNEKK